MAHPILQCAKVPRNEENESWLLCSIVSAAVISLLAFKKIVKNCSAQFIFEQAHFYQQEAGVPLHHCIDSNTAQLILRCMAHSYSVSKLIKALTNEERNLRWEIQIWDLISAASFRCAATLQYIQCLKWKEHLWQVGIQRISNWVLLCTVQIHVREMRTMRPWVMAWLLPFWRGTNICNCF